ncbi:MAG: hypothetical protein Hyperionvirus3_96 [Hyperionvirus sp.]|uniref:BTB domain-containing protein n=1 Tax=Hyperionvirus sp. TaxID=2487770 RepID=A0A3G5A6R5_9VIRU|nr:MAG: hypothetical protein Hyperionvirus3_96 [Hyperionvirus sp.]
MAAKEKQPQVPDKVPDEFYFMKHDISFELEGKLLPFYKSAIMNHSLLFKKAMSKNLIDLIEDKEEDKKMTDLMEISGNIIKIKNYTFDDFKIFLESIYPLGPKPVSSTSVFTILKISFAYKCQRIQDCCIYFIKIYDYDTSIDSIVNWLLNLKECCERYKDKIEYLTVLKNKQTEIIEKFSKDTTERKWKEEVWKLPNDIFGTLFEILTREKNSIHETAERHKLYAGELTWQIRARRGRIDEPEALIGEAAKRHKVDPIELAEAYSSKGPKD